MIALIIFCFSDLSSPKSTGYKLNEILDDIENLKQGSEAGSEYASSEASCGKHYTYVECKI